jgi:hypothetical protein
MLRQFSRVKPTPGKLLDERVERCHRSSLED